MIFRRMIFRATFATIRSVPDFYDFDRANARIPELRETLLTLRSLREDLVAARDRIVELNAPALAGGAATGGAATGGAATGGAATGGAATGGAATGGAAVGGAATGGAAAAPARPPDADQETQRLRMRMQGLVDQMQATVLRIDGWGIQLRDIETGLVDFPALVAGRPVWLCWRLDEAVVGWWHEASEGFDARRRIEDLV